MRWENLTEDKAPSKEGVLNFIKKNCQQYIQENPEWMTTLLYRGIQINTDDDIVVKSIRSDRRPLDTHQVLHDLYDEALKRAGIMARRSNSIFCSGNIEVAEGYGEICVVFPIGRFEYSWSPEYPDLTYEISTISNDGGFEFKNMDKPLLTVNDLDLVYNDEKEKFAEGNFPKKFSYNFMVNEILPKIGSNKNIWLRTIDKQLLLKLGVDVDVLSNLFKKSYKTTNLLSAIESHSEIMIAGSSYLAVKIDVWNEIIG